MRAKRRLAATTTETRLTTEEHSDAESTDAPSAEADDQLVEWEARVRRHTYLQSLPLSDPTTHPRARDDEAIVAQEVLDEFVVYDLYRHRVHALNPTAATVWHWCDGHTPLTAMTDRLMTRLALGREQAEHVLYLALDRLEKAKLLEARATRPRAYRRVRRRQVLGLVAASLLPVVASLVAPSAADAASCVGRPSDVPACQPCAVTGACCDCATAGCATNKKTCCAPAGCICVSNDTQCATASGVVCDDCSL